MLNQSYFDQEAFTKDVMEILKTKKLVEPQEDDADDFEFIYYGTDEDNSELEINRKAGDLIKRQDIRQLLCPALKSGVNDVFEVVKVIAPLVGGAVVAGTLAFPLNPIIFAAFALLIARMSIESFCKGI